jgi:Ca-activated chloride channel family protein
VSFAAPAFAYAAAIAAVVLAILVALDVTQRRRVLERVGHLPMLRRMTASLSPRRRVLKAVLWIAGITLVMLAAAQPQVAGESSWRQRGIDIAVVMDYSKSMLARDVSPSRYQATLDAAEGLVDSLGADRVATVIFSGAAIHFPLTHDHQAAKLLYRGINPLDLSPGSDVGEAMRVARCILRPDVLQDGSCERIGGRGGGGDPLDDTPLDGESALEGKLRALEKPAVKADRARAIVFFTDGEDTVGQGRAEVELAADLGIQIFFVGVGTTAGELIPEHDRAGAEIGWKKHRDGSFVRSRLDQAGLKELATLAGGEDHYFHLGAGGFELEALVSELQRLKKGDLDERVVRSNKPIFQLFLFPGFLLLLIEACIGERRRRRRRSQLH